MPRKLAISRMQRNYLLILVFFGVCWAILIGLFATEVKVSIIRALYPAGWDEYQALTKMLVLGMSPDAVVKILGEPAIKDHFAVGDRWIYAEDQPTSDWTYIVEFRRLSGSTNLLELCYVLNMKDRIIPDAPRSQMGIMLKLTQPGGTYFIGDPTYEPQTAK